MAEKYFFFNSTLNDPRVHDARDFASFYDALLNSGIFHKDGDVKLRVHPNGGMSVRMEAGKAFIKGHHYHNDDDLILNHNAADPELDRIDRVVLRLDNSQENRYIKAFILAGEPSEKPEPPELTREGDIYEISLAQVLVIADSGNITNERIIDERLNESVCGLVSSLISIPTDEIMEQRDELERKWQEWFDGIQGETYVPRQKLKEGFIIAPEDKLYFIPETVMQHEKKGWPFGAHDRDVSLQSLGIDNDGNLYINELDQLYEMVTRYNVLADKPSHELWSGRQLAVPFTPEAEAKHLNITMRLKRNSIGQLRAIIYETGESGLPETSKELGRYFSNDHNELETTFSELTWGIPLNKNLDPNKSYYLVLYGRSADFYIQAEYADTPGEGNYLISTDNGSTWQSYERTPVLEIEGAAPLKEGTVTISYEKIANFYKHASLFFELTDAEHSHYKAEILNMEGQVLLPNLKPGQCLFDDHLTKDTQLRITIIRAEGEDPRLSNYKHSWVADISHSRLEQGMVPSDDALLFIPAQHSVDTGYQGAARELFKFKVGKGGCYKVRLEVRFDTTTQSAIVYFNYLADSGSIQLGSVRSNETSYVERVVELKAVPPNAIIQVTAGNSSTLSGRTVRVRNISIMGSPGYNTMGVI